MYEAVYAHPDGDATVSRFAATAERHGYDGLVVRAVDARPDYEALREEVNVDIVDAAEVVAPHPRNASGAVGNFRPDRTLVVVRGGTNELNRFAVEQARVDVLARPFGDDGDVNHVLAKAARDNGVAIEVNFGPVLRRTGGTRVQHLRKLRKLSQLIDHYDAPHVVSVGAESHLQVRAPRELAAVGEEVGLGAEFVREGLAAWGDIAARNRERMSESFIAPGVKRDGYEEDD
ncbi:RNase P subunit p30 family protein [Halopelagius longus]|uniref:Ribonuclease P protein component 3 n=1 Tax=Halopelagius longus TaxID=1236180 RepID=A0A1H1C3C2_9EURY|nr:RNase P subunit p30 family protein [Halopelagius longus]RDI71028.1 ribonuclease P [Halopelagius longus]SDQ58166.1 ribonuclease P protein subunit Rpp30 [Halopelagius longus]